MSFESKGNRLSLFISGVEEYFKVGAEVGVLPPAESSRVRSEAEQVQEQPSPSSSSVRIYQLTGS